MKVLTVPKEEKGIRGDVQQQRQMLLWDCSELELEGLVERGGTADLRKRIEAAVRPAGAQTVRQSLR